MGRVAGTGAADLTCLARAAAAGDDRATRALVVAIGPAVLRVVRRVLGAAHPDVEDVAQEAIIGLLRALGGYRGACGLVHYACRIAALVALQARRLRSPPWLGAASIDPDEAEDARRPQPFAATAQTRRRAVVRALLDDLPIPQAEALILHLGCGYTVEEIAAAGDTPANTVRSRLRLAKRALRERVRGDRALAEALDLPPLVLGGER
jgi:RNA polymerase sigma-70 factor (ECF subfamily)